MASIDDEVMAWVKDYVKNHPCRNCKGTGVVGTAPWLYTCDYCHQTGLDWHHDEPTFTNFLDEIKTATTMDDTRQVIITFQRKYELSRVFEGKMHCDQFPR